MQRRLSITSLSAQCGLLALVLAGYHLALRLLMTEWGLRLGAVSYKLAPLYAFWRPHLKGWLLAPVAVLAVYFAVLRRTRFAVSMTDRRAAAFITMAFLAIATSVAMIDGGPRALVGPLGRTDLEYYGAVERVCGVAEFLRDYSRLVPSLPMHARVHPPGAVLFVWAACKMLGGGPWAAAAGIIGFSALIVPIAFVWARRLADPGVARRVAALVSLAPGVVLFSATSMDGPFAVFLLATMWLFWESLESRPWQVGALAGLAATAAALMTFSVAVTLLFCGVAAVTTWIVEPARRRSVLTACASALATFLGLHVLLWLATGYDAIEMFRVAVANHAAIMAGTRHESLVRFVHLAVANLVVFFITAGLPCAVLWWAVAANTVREMFRRPRTQSPSISDAPGPRSTHDAFHWSSHRRFVVAALVTLVVSACVPVYTLEVERVWMFLVPLVVIPVATRLWEQERGTGRIYGSLAVAVLLAFQTCVTEVLLTTYW